MTFTPHKPARAAGRLSLVLLALLVSTAALADENTGWYIGGTAGQSTATIDDSRILSGLTSQGASSATVSDSSRDSGYKLFGGYQFNRHVAVEAGAFDLGSFGFKATTLPPGTLTGNANFRGVNLDLVGTLPITERFSVFGRIGADYTETKGTFTASGLISAPNPNPSAKEWNPKIGLGIQYAFTKALSMRAEVERHRVNDAVGNKGDIDLISFSLVYRLGTDKSTLIAESNKTLQIE